METIIPSFGKSRNYSGKCFAKFNKIEYSNAEEREGVESMLFLILAVLSSSVLAIVLKYLGSGYGYGVYFFNYVTCAVLAFVTMEKKSLWNGDPLPLWLGAVSGFLYLAALIVYAHSIRKNGAVLSSVFTRLGVLVPIFVSVVLFGERPTPLQGLGILVAVLAAVVMNGLPKKGQDQGVTPGVAIVPLLLALLFNGASDSMSKIFTQLGARQDDGLFVFYIFLFAGLFTLILLLREKQKPTRRDVLLGILVGVPNFFSSRLLLAALTELPAFLVYPSYSVGAILVISAASFILFRERLNRRQLGAVGMILGALVLLNL
jgi:drug/metabolite transporter (DMT)-like permease